MGPWLDMAYMVLPRKLIAAGLAARRLIRQPERPGADGAGANPRRRRLCAALASAHQGVCAAARRAGERIRHQIGGGTDLGEQAGLHLSSFPPAEFGPPAGVAALARHCGLEAATPASEAPHSGVVLIGFGLLPERQLEARVARFAASLPAPGTAVRAAD